ncbi:hypothetical protein HYDPIDRAFT_44455 [Hydnomerulius pinastri MD-312]|uniref:Uncharacterized protein n=1 Tax=Hydnomerulius pinastri MD-312 TaxID=994086 RepID=A0A0C9VYK1_9AGAM|nr:hypothetical protein HYDPIDRAFT_44455 [Hydnomerulius pinastri MD-312]
MAIVEAGDEKWIRDRFISTRFRLCAYMLIVAYPGLVLSISVLSLTLAICFAGTEAEVFSIRALAWVAVIGWIWIPVTTTWCLVSREKWQQPSGSFEAPDPEADSDLVLVRSTTSFDIVPVHAL